MGATAGDGGAIVVFDTEYTAWAGSRERGWSEPWEHREVVQIGAVRLRAGDLAETGHLDLVVRPAVNPVLSDYFVDLTGITNQRLAEEGMPLAAALERFAAFVAEGDQFVANGDDLGVITENCKLARIGCPLPAERFRNLRHDLGVAFDRPDGVDSYTLTQRAGVASVGRAHDALADARAIAAALGYLRREGRPLAFGP